jgi:hypothetical protein
LTSKNKTKQNITLHSRKKYIKKATMRNNSNRVSDPDLGDRQAKMVIKIGNSML